MAAPNRLDIHPVRRTCRLQRSQLSASSHFLDRPLRQVVVVAMTAAAVLQVAAAVASAAQVGVEVEAAATVAPKG